MLEWFQFPWRKSNFDNLDNLESSLEAAFKPVEPSPEFVRELRRNLVNFPIPAPDSSGSKVPLYIALTIASLLSGVAIVGVGVWIILALVGKIQSRDKRMASSSNLLL